MAQRVEAVENPRYSVPGLTTTSGSIVSTRAVLVPPTIQGIFKGNGDYSNGGNQYIQFQIADNECFLDNKCLFLVCTLLVYGPNNVELNNTGRQYGNPIDLYFDQSSDALFSQITIGSPQGLKFEEIQQYNMWANIVRLHTESAAHKEHDLLRYTEFSKDKGKSYGLQHLTDDQWREPTRIPVGVPTRIAIRFDFSDFMQNIDLFPLFLMRNGLQITLYLENVYKAMYCPSGMSSAKDLRLHSGYSTFSYVFGTGGAQSNGTARIIVAGDNNNVMSGSQYFSPFYQLSSNFYGTPQAVTSTSSIWLDYKVAGSILAQTGFRGTAMSTSEFVAIPVTIKEFNQVVWSGFALAPTFMPLIVSSVALKDAYNVVAGNEDQMGHPISIITWGITNVSLSAFDTNVSSAQGNVKQLDVDGSLPAYDALTTNAFAFSRLPFNNAYGLTNANTLATVANWHLFSFNDTQPIPFLNISETQTSADLVTANNQHVNSGGEVIFHIGDSVLLSTYGSAQATTANAATQIPTPPLPANTVFTIASADRNAFTSILSQWMLTEQQRKFRYEISQPQLLLNLIKPSAEVALRWQNEFTQPSGIAIKYKKVIYRKNSFNEQSSGLLMVTLPISVRSLTGLIFVIQDPALDSLPNNTINCMTLANLSTFQNRRLTEQYIQVGGQQYPVYLFQMRPDGDNQQYGDAHILELEKLFAVAGSSSFNSSLTRPMIKKTRNMLAGGYLGAVNPIQLAQLGPANRCTYLDACGCVYGMNLSKDWQRTFTCGIDSSAVGNIALNLYFKDPSNASNVSPAFGPSTNATNQSGARSFSLHMFAICDAVATLQESANMVRF